MEDEDVIEQTLHIAREVSVYRIPPRGPTGHTSGAWKVGDKLFSGRLRVVSKGEVAEIRIEDASSGELFAVAPIPPGKRSVYVEPATDSSRYYVLRVEDQATKRHAFLGMGFEQRGDAFDFQEALVRHERQVERERSSAAHQPGGSPGSSLGGQGGGASGSGRVSTGGGSSTTVEDDVNVLYADHGDLSLRDGQTIHVSIPRKGKAGSFDAGSGAQHKAGGLVAPLLPPPPPAPAMAPVLLPPPGDTRPPPPPAPAAAKALLPKVPGAPASAAAPPAAPDLLTSFDQLSVAAAAAPAGGLDLWSELAPSFATAPPAAATPAVQPPVAGSNPSQLEQPTGWATFE